MRTWTDRQTKTIAYVVWKYVWVTSRISQNGTGARGIMCVSIMISMNRFKRDKKKMGIAKKNHKDRNDGDLT